MRKKTPHAFRDHKSKPASPLPLPSMPQIGTREEVIHGQRVTVRVFAPGGRPKEELKHLAPSLFYRDGGRRIPKAWTSKGFDGQRGFGRLARAEGWAALDLLVMLGLGSFAFALLFGKRAAAQVEQERTHGGARG